MYNILIEIKIKNFTPRIFLLSQFDLNFIESLYEERGI